MESTEAWRPVVGYEGLYEVSDHGRVRSIPRVDSRGRRIRGGILALTRAPSGHVGVKLSRGGVYERGKVHRMVLTAFIGPAPEGHEALHGDGDPANNRLENLRWGTRSENIRDSVRHGTHFWAKKTHCPQGHPYSPTNTHMTSDGRRMCKECGRTQLRNRRSRARERKAV